MMKTLPVEYDWHCLAYRAVCPDCGAVVYEIGMETLHMLANNRATHVIPENVPHNCRKAAEREMVLECLYCGVTERDNGINTQQVQIAAFQSEHTHHIEPEHVPEPEPAPAFNLDSCFGYGFKQRYLDYIKTLPLGASVEWVGRLHCLHCGALVSLPVMHKDWHKKNGK